MAIRLSLHEAAKATNTEMAMFMVENWPDSLKQRKKWGKSVLAVSSSPHPPAASANGTFG
jgi:hypothetical protein